MRAFLSALGFLTIIPVGKNIAYDKGSLARSLIYFPIIGLLLGAILIGANKLFLFLNLNPLLNSAAIVVLLIVLTGALHLDGLSDTFDAISSGKPKDEMLKIMRDSTTGAFGVISLICVIMLKVLLIYSIGAGIKNQALVLMCLLSRYSLVFAMAFFPYAREAGKAKAFTEGANKKIFLIAAAITLAGSLFLFKQNGAIIFLIVTAFAFFFSRFAKRLLSGITGDILGAINEMSETLVLALILLLKSLYL